MGIERWTDSIQWGPSRVRDVSTNHCHCFRRRISDTILSLGILVLCREEGDPTRVGSCNLGFFRRNVSLYLS